MNWSVISDIHYGDRRCNPSKVAEVINFIAPTDCLIVDGDLIDSWVRRKLEYNTLRTVLFHPRIKDIIVVRGNHDPEDLQSILGDKASVVDAFNIITTLGKIRVIHGHEYDHLLHQYSRLARWAFYLHQFIFFKFGWDIQRLMRLSLSSRKNSSYFKNLIKESMGHMLKDYEGYYAIICGHTHYPIHYEYYGLNYFNCGDLIENFSYVKVNEDGEIRLCGYFPTEA